MDDRLHELLTAARQARDRGALADASAHYEAALAVSRSCADPLHVAHIARHLGDVYRERGLQDPAERLLEESIAAYRGSLGTRVLDLANALRPLALLYGARHDSRSAALWREARTLYAAIQVSAGVAECDQHLAGRSAP